MSDILIAQGTARVAFAVICQGYFLLWGAFLSACFIHFAFRLRTVMRAGGTIAGKTRAMFFVTRASCFVCLVWIAIAAWWLAAVVNDKNVTDVNVVTIFGLQTASRIAELLVVYLLIPSPLGTLCRIVGAKAEFGEEKTSILAANGLGASNHALAELWKTNRHPLQFLLPDDDGLADGGCMKCLVRVEHAKALDLLLLVNQLNDVGLSVFLHEDSPFC